jgi:hypothetical protein
MQDQHQDHPAIGLENLVPGIGGGKYQLQQPDHFRAASVRVSPVLSMKYGMNFA